MLAGTERSLYALDAETGEALWRRKNARLDETDVAPIPGTDLVLLTFERGDKTRIEAADVLTGDTIWQSERVRGAVMQMAVDASARLLAVVVVRDARGRAREGFKRRPSIHVFNLATGDERWRREVESEVEMMPARWGADGDTAYTLDNYRAPLFLDGRLFFFYEGATSVDAETGKERERERFRVNEDGLALTEADPLFDESFIYTSGRGRVRAVSRRTGEVEWEAKDLGLTPEMLLTRGVLYVRTGGQFARLRDGETVERGPYGVSAIDARTGKTLWRYKGADKGITNLALPDDSTILIADRDDLIFIDAATGKRRSKVSHGVERAAFVLINEAGQAVVGGRNTIEGIDVRSGERIWRARHNAPGRGILRTVTAVAARAAALYFRYGGVATAAFRGAQLARAASGLRSGVRLRAAAMPALQSLATDAARDYVSTRFTPFGVASRLESSTATATSTVRRARQVESLRTGRALPRPSVDVEERLLDRLDPARQLERLSSFLLRRRRLAALRGEWMYYYTDLPGDGNGLAGVNINNGQTERAIRLSDPDERFFVDETTGLLHTAKDNHLLAYEIRNR